MPPRFVSDTLRAVHGKRERRKEARPGELVDAALDLFVEKGYAATRSEEVAARAGVSKGTLFLYFPSKEALFQAVIQASISGRFANWNTEFEAFEGSTPEMLRYCMRTWWEHMGSTRLSGIAKLMMSEGHNFPELANYYRREVVDPAHELLRRILRRGIARGEFAPLDVEHGIYLIVAPMTFLMLWKHSATACIDPAMVLSPERYLELQTDTLLHGLCAPDPRGGHS